MAGGALSAFRQLGYAFGIAVLGEVFRSGLTHAAGPGLSAALSGGQAQAVLARTPALAPVVHRAFADGLDLAYAVAAGFGLLAAVAVFTLARPRQPGRECRRDCRSIQRSDRDRLRGREPCGPDLCWPDLLLALLARAARAGADAGGPSLGRSDIDPGDFPERPRRQHVLQPLVQFGQADAAVGHPGAQHVRGHVAVEVRCPQVRPEHPVAGPGPGRPAPE